MKQLKVTKIFIYFSILITFAGSLSACGTTMRYSRNITMYEPMKEVSIVKGLELAIPKGETKKTESFMIAFVEPSYEVKPFKGSVSEIDMPKTMKMGYGRAYKKSDIAKEKYLDVIPSSLRTDLDYILLQKHIRVLGTFKSRDEMTFDQKKRAIYTFTPIITIIIDEQQTITDPGKGYSGRGYSERGTFTVRGYINLLLMESITGEKVWIKRIEANPIMRPYEFTAKFQYPDMIVTDVAMLMAQGIEEKDNSDRALIDALSEFYISLGKKLWDHIDPEEWEKYIDQALALRGIKRY